MHRSMLFTVLLLFNAPLSADTRTEITTALDFFAQVWNENDIEAMQGYYHSEFVQVSDDGTVERAQHLENIRDLIDDGGDRGKLDYTDVTVRELGDDHAMAFGKMALTFRDGSSIDSWFATVYEKTPFGWKALMTRN